MAEYWEILGLRAAPETRDEVDTAFLARFEILKDQKDPSILIELQRAYDLAVSVVAFDAETADKDKDKDEQSEGDASQDGLTLDDFVELSSVPQVLEITEPAAPPNKQDLIDELKEKTSENSELSEVLELIFGTDWPSEIALLDYDLITELIEDLDVPNEISRDTTNFDTLFNGKHITDLVSELDNQFAGAKDTSKLATLPSDYDDANKAHKSKKFTTKFIENPRSFKGAVILLYKRCFDVTTRSSRAEFWWSFLYLFAAMFLWFFFISLYLEISNFESDRPVTMLDYIIGVPYSIFCIVHIVPYLSLYIRRILDHGMKRIGGLVALVAISLLIHPPIAPFFAALPLYFRGTEGDNAFGPDPLDI